MSEWEEGFKVGEDIGYLSAAIDGEGHIGIAKSKSKGKYISYGLTVRITNTDLLFLIRLRDICLGEGSIKPRVKDKTSKKVAYDYRIPTEFFRELLPRLSLTVKLQHASIARRYFGLVNSGYPRQKHTELEMGELERLYQEMKELNRR